MGLDKVKEEIIRKAKEQAEAIITEGREEAEKIAKEAEGKIKENKEKIEAELKKTGISIKKKGIASAELEVKKILLQEKKRAIENIFEEVKNKLAALNDKKREEYIKKLIEKAQKEINVKYIYCNKKDRKFIKDFEVEETDILGGLIAENEKRDTSVDYSYETILENIKEKHLQGIGKVLFD